MEIQGKQIPMPHLHDAAAQASGCFCSVCLELCNCKSFFVTHSKQNPAVTDKSLHVATYVCRSVQISCKKTAWLSYYQTRYERWTQTLWSLCRSLKQSICCCVCDKRGVYLIHKPHTCTVAAHHPILEYSSFILVFNFNLDFGQSDHHVVFSKSWEWNHEVIRGHRLHWKLSPCWPWETVQAY